MKIDAYMEIAQINNITNFVAPIRANVNLIATC